MTRVILALAMSWLLLSLFKAWHLYTIRRRWEHAVREQENWVATAADEFSGFLANPAAGRRGGVAVRTARRKMRQGLLERMAQAEVNRFLQSEVTRKRQAGDVPGHPNEADGQPNMGSNGQSLVIRHGETSKVWYDGLKGVSC